MKSFHKSQTKAKCLLFEGRPNARSITPVAINLRLHIYIFLCSNRVCASDKAETPNSKDFL